MSPEVMAQSLRFLRSIDIIQSPHSFQVDRQTLVLSDGIHIAILRYCDTALGPVTIVGLDTVELHNQLLT